MKLQDFQSSKCSYPAHVPFSVQWSDDNFVALATAKGVYVSGGGWQKKIAFTVILMVFMLLGKIECGNITTAVFGTKTDGLPAAFGDFNSDEYPDLFVINRTRKSIEVLLGGDVEPYLRTHKGLKCNFQQEVTSVVPGDFDGDALMDVLVTLKTNVENISSVRIFWGNDREILDCSDNVELFQLKGQPLAMDYNQDMIIDLFGVKNDSQRTFWIFANKSKPHEEPMLQDENRHYEELRIPHSHAFLDLDGDNAADLLLTEKYGFEIWHWAKEEKRFIFDKSKKIVVPQGAVQVGQSLFMDLELKGKMDHILPICFNADCTNSSIYVYSSGTWHNLKIVFFDGSNNYGFIPPNKNELFLEAITLHGGDFNMDGYPDLLATLQHNNEKRSYLLENVECKTNCLEFSRTFEVKWHALDPYNNNTILGVFYDFLQDGVLDIIFVHNERPLRVSAFKNSLDYDANFVKVMVITGLKDKKQPVIPGPLGRKNRTYGTNLPGPKIAYQTTTQEGNIRAAIAAQLPQSAYFCLHLPYTLFGLGRTPNFIDNLLVGISGYKRNWPQIIPNSQMVVIPRPPDKPQSWTARLFVTPSKLIVQSVIALVATCVFISLIIGVLYWKERREDNYEKFQFIQ